MAESIKHEDWHLVDMHSAPSCSIARIHLGIFNSEPQPIFSEDKSLCIFMDGKIYDYEDERRKLQLGADKSSTTSYSYSLLLLFALAPAEADSGSIQSPTSQASFMLESMYIFPLHPAQSWHKI